MEKKVGDDEDGGNEGKVGYLKESAKGFSLVLFVEVYIFFDIDSGSFFNVGFV